MRERKFEYDESIFGGLDIVITPIVPTKWEKDEMAKAGEEELLELNNISWVKDRTEAVFNLREDNPVKLVKIHD